MNSDENLLRMYKILRLFGRYVMLMDEDIDGEQIRQNLSVTLEAILQKLDNSDESLPCEEIDELNLYGTDNIDRQCGDIPANEIRQCGDIPENEIRSLEVGGDVRMEDPGLAALKSRNNILSDDEDDDDEEGAGNVVFNINSYRVVLIAHCLWAADPQLIEQLLKLGVSKRKTKESKIIVKSTINSENSPCEGALLPIYKILIGLAPILTDVQVLTMTVSVVTVSSI